MNKIIKLGMLIALGALAYGAWWYKNTSRGPAIDFKNAMNVTNVVPVVVIGSGPAGLSAALYAARSALYTVVFQGKTPGGQLTTTSFVENWPGTPKMLGSKLIEQNRKQAEKYGALMITDSVVQADLSRWPFVLKTEDGVEIHALSVIIATGANPKLLNDTKVVPGEKEYWGYGVTTCAICDAAFYKDKKVVVIGGGDSAVEEATLLTSYASSVQVLVRGDKMRAAPAMQARLKDPKITVLYNTEPLEIVGDGTSVTGMRVKNTKTNKEELLPIDGVFLAIGHKPNSEIFKEYITIDKDTGYIILPTRGQKTSMPGIFAAGDVADHVYRQAGVAAGDGIKAALDALAFLQEHGYNAAVAQQLEKNFWYPHKEEAGAELPQIATNKDFDKLAKEHDFIVLDVGADHCASCKTLLPVVQSVAAQLADKVHFAQIDTTTDSSKELVKRFEIKGIPVLLVFKKDKLIARYDQQVFTKRQLSGMISQLISE